MELSAQIIAELRSLVERITQGQPTPAKKFLFETLFGPLSSGSVLLTEVGRKLPPTGTLHAVEKRLSRQALRSIFSQAPANLSAASGAPEDNKGVENNHGAGVRGVYNGRAPAITPPRSRAA